MNRRVLAITLLLAFPIWANAAQPATGQPLVLGQRFTIQSPALKEERTYLVHRPAGYDISNARYPVLIVTDGNEHFQHVSTTVDFMAAAGEIPPMIVVGIPNTDRYRDLLAYAYAKTPGPSPLLKFITDELVPRIDAEYRTHPYRMLMGWSDGGLFALHTMISAPQAFRGYIMLATALGDDTDMPKRLTEFFAAHPTATLNADAWMGMDDVKGFGLGWSWDTASILEKRAWRVKDLRFTYRYYADEGHMGIALGGLQDGLRTIFTGWTLANPFSQYEAGGLPAIEKHYTALSERMGYPVAVPADVLFTTFNDLEYRRRYDEALRVISRAVEMHPQDTTALYYQARVLNRMGNKPQALETLKKSLLLSPNDGSARGLLKEMQVDPGTLAAEVKVSAKDLARYAGRYGNGATLLTVELRGERLYATTLEKEYLLTATTATRFRCREDSVYSDGVGVEFKSDARGRVTALAFDNGPEYARLK